MDAAAAGLELGWLQPNGRLTHVQSFPLAAPVSLTQSDVRELQLAKGAIAAGLRLLLEHRGATRNDVQQIFSPVPWQLHQPGQCAQDRLAGFPGP